MDARSKAKREHIRRVCVRIALAFCLVAFGLGEAVERAFAGHVGLETALSYAAASEQQAGVSADHHSGIHVESPSGEVEKGGAVVGHGCHGCAALHQPVLQAAAPSILDAPPAWASVPSTVGREPLVDLPPPRA